MLEDNQLLKNAALNDKLKNNGFLKVSFLPMDCIEQIKSLYEETRLEHERVGKVQAFHATQDCGSFELTKYIDKRAKEILNPYIEKEFINHRVIMANFILKAPGEASRLTPHQDWTFVDETQFATYGFWTAIEDTNAQNGNLQFLPGSHRIKQTLRVNYDYPCAFSNVIDLAKENLVEVGTKKGESVLLNHSVLHGSRPNLSQNTRVALTLGITHKDAQLYHYYCEDGHTVYKYRIDLEILEGLRYQVKPKDEFLEEVFNFDFPIITKEEFKEWLKNQVKDDK